MEIQTKNLITEIKAALEAKAAREAAKAAKEAEENVEA